MLLIWGLRDHILVICMVLKGNPGQCLGDPSDLGSQTYLGIDKDQGLKLSLFWELRIRDHRKNIYFFTTL